MKNVKKIGMVFCFFILLLSFSFQTYAAKETEELGENEIRIKALYDEELEPSRTDKFVITCKETDTGKTEKINLDAQKAVDDYVTVSLKKGHYEVTEITYKGTNTKITDYATNRTFTNDLILYLAVGNDNVKKLRQTYASIYTVSSLSELERELSSDYEKSEMLDAKEASEKALTSEATGRETTQGYSEQFKTVDESPSVIHYTQGEEDDNTESGKKTIPFIYIVFFAVFGMIVLLVLKKIETKNNKK